MKISEMIATLKEARETVARADEIDGMYSHAKELSDLSTLIVKLEAGEVIEDDR